MHSASSAELRSRIDDRVAEWQIIVERVTETESSVLAFGRRGHQAVVLKVIKNPGDEWRSGEILEAFDGKGVVRVYEHAEGALLLERLNPGRPLAIMALNGADDEATEVLAEGIRRMSPHPPRRAVPTAADWGRGFVRYAASGDAQIPPALCSTARRVYSELCSSQGSVRLLHGDLHHYNMLFDDKRGWLAIDPKGVVAELEYEVGAVLRNPYERPALFVEPSIIRKRVDHFTRVLDLDSRRILSWAFAQAVLSAIWSVEDGGRIEPDNGWIALADALRPMLDGSVDA
jgi:streptomycin 6-kinase